MLPSKKVKRYEISEELSDKKRSELGEAFAKVHRQLQETDKSMLVIVDGWESSGKGFLLKDLTRELDPKYFEVEVFEESGVDDSKFPYLRRFFRRAPRKGQIMFFDRSFYYDLFHSLDLSGKRLEHIINDISFVERALHDDDTLIVKFFIHQSKSEMANRIASLEQDDYRDVLLDDSDYDQLKHYKDYFKHFSEILNRTNFAHSPWHILYTDGKKDQSRLALATCIDELEKWLAADLERPLPQLEDLSKQTPPLSTLDLSLTISESDYHDIKDALQEEAADLLYQAYREDKGVIIAYEGTDAAGKGGNIERLTRLMDPRGYDVATVAAPNEEEDSHHYLWRFYRDFPSQGRMTIFDRSWYGRVLVEAIEGFTPDYRTQEAYAEINQMEHNLTHQGYLVLKYLIIIDEDEQYDRFMGREKNPDKQYKITDEDWRNREKFSDYVEAMNEMFLRTSTDHAPWLLVPGNDKRYARIMVLKDFIKRMRDFLAEEE
ncbi:phosphate:AMP phosphotransferase [Aerococcus kribbianus]|uniref:Phosphate:AMP phosphotransferase n=1 Tax=Aerococcus kribbianus TaxID=2999064 RepID=A0A9X3JEP5_9LACT|nr:MULTISPECIES: phosphate:AMP phosphotransferase [unclassified Aerococcus]MCZ0716823.1 phosphate:AMP phosphotransferase [Aerococcus sp. YH-aer221]MCZ0725111.1 phosphate:AMP phosphotransferase [Aerococcus sp. YH-aer222]